MARPVGTPNHDHDAKRERLITGMLPVLLAPGGAQASLRTLSKSAGVTLPTLRHYFASRDALYVEAMAHLTRLGARFLDEAVEVHPHDDVTAHLRDFLTRFRLGWETFGVGRIVAMGLEAGLSREPIGEGFIMHTLEPMLASVERRLDACVQAGVLRDADARFMALSLMSPLILAMLHQGPLGGRCQRPLDLDAFVSHHIAAFVRAYGPAHTK